MKIKEGDYIAKIPKESSKTKDITGGLPKSSRTFLKLESQRTMQLLQRFQEKLSLVKIIK